MSFARCTAGTLLVAAMLFAPSAEAGPIVWTNWGPGFSANATVGSTTGTMGGVNVGYSGELESLLLGYPSYAPVGTFSGGTVGNIPSPNQIIQLFGGGQTIDTVTFSSPVTNPVMAIWSLGQGGVQASFQFLPSEPFTIESGGPSAEYAGNHLHQQTRSGWPAASRYPCGHRG